VSQNIKTLETIVGPDIYTSEDLRDIDEFEIQQTGITETPFRFRRLQFDLLESRCRCSLERSIPVCKA